jgi:hypothetical protein
MALVTGATHRLFVLVVPALNDAVRPAHLTPFCSEQCVYAEPEVALLTALHH